MAEVSDVGFVLRTWPYRDSDAIVSLFTHEHGKVRGVARGAKKPKGRWAGALDPLTEVSIAWQERDGQELVTLTDCSIVRSPYHPSPTLEATWSLALVAELVDESASPEDADEVSYRLVKAAVAAVCAGRPPLVVARHVQAWLLRLHGVLPDFGGRCVTCGGALQRTGGTWHWSVHGLACPRCMPDGSGPTVFPADIAFLDEVRRHGPGDLDAPAPAVLRRVSVLLRRLVHEFLGKDLKSERFLDELERLDGEASARGGLAEASARRAPEDRPT